MNYVVQPGDTLSSIARRFNTTVNAILAANRQITDPNVIFPGQIIIIPGVGPTPPPPTPPPTPPPIPVPDQCPLLRQGAQGPAVRRLQNLLRAANFDPGPIDGVFGPRTQAALLAFQRSTRELVVTGVADRETWTALGAQCQPLPTPPGGIRYIARLGDTLFIIATRFNVTVEAILRINPNITDPNNILAGQVINIPGR